MTKHYALFISVIILVCVFVTDWYFSPEKELLTEGILGMLIGGVIGWWGAYVNYETTNGYPYERPIRKVKEENIFEEE